MVLSQRMPVHQAENADKLARVITGAGRVFQSHSVSFIFEGMLLPARGIKSIVLAAICDVAVVKKHMRKLVSDNGGQLCFVFDAA